MAVEQSIWGYFVHASPIVKMVMLLLLGASVASWTLIFQRGKLLKQAKQALTTFEQRFWSGIELSALYRELEFRNDATGAEGIFQVGFKEFMRLRQNSRLTVEEILEGVQRVMRAAHWREMDKLEENLPFLATVGSTSPYVGLFGTVWGIMTAFHALGSVQQATIAMVAPGISEALVATAMGLFAAIPAVISFNRFSAITDRLANHYEAFQDEFASVLCHSAAQRGNTAYAQTGHVQ